MANKDIIGYNSDDKNVFNSIGNIYGDNFDINFVKDPDKLLYQYSNLIHKLGKKYAHRFSNEADRQALFAYIYDAFYSLVVEYDPKSGVDFPGYINRKLKDRVYFSYVNKLQPATKLKATKVSHKKLKNINDNVYLIDKDKDIVIHKVYYSDDHPLVDNQDYFVSGNRIILYAKALGDIYADYTVYHFPKSAQTKEFLLKQGDLMVEDLLSYKEESHSGGSYDRKGRLTFWNADSLVSDDSLFELVYFLENNYDLIDLDYLILKFLSTGNPNEHAMINEVKMKTSEYSDKEIHKEFLKLRRMIKKYLKQTSQNDSK